MRKTKACIISYVHIQFISCLKKDKPVISQQQRLIYFPFVGILILSSFVVLFLATRKRFSKSTRSNKVTKHKVATPPNEALKYWTADKMQNAKATPLPEVNNLDRGKQEPRPSPTQDV